MSDVVKKFVEDTLDKLKILCDETEDIDKISIYGGIALGRIMMLKDLDLLSDKVYSDVSNLIYNIIQGDEEDER